jgi:hypothetical protein
MEGSFLQSSLGVTKRVCSLDTMMFYAMKYSLLILDSEFEAALVEMMVRHRTRQSNGEPDGELQFDLSLTVVSVIIY